MIQYNRFVFASPPRTGGTWFMHAAEICGMGDGHKSQLHIPFPDNLGDCAVAISMCRHPYDWLVSYHLALKGGACGVDCVDRFCELSKQVNSVESFIRSYLDNCPGAVSEMFAAYKAHVVLRTEDLPWNAAELFQSFGVKNRKINEIKDMPTMNARRGMPHLVNRDLRRKVFEADREFCETYEYYG